LRKGVIRKPEARGTEMMPATGSSLYSNATEGLRTVLHSEPSLTKEKDNEKSERTQVAPEEGVADPARGTSEDLEQSALEPRADGLVVTEGPTVP
jgi:hypothetical protein